MYPINKSKTILTTNKFLITALLLGVVFHGVSIFYTLEGTYDALVHLFFSEHYASNWFEPWNYKWYTGFSVMSYPPLVHQSIALLSFIGGLKFGLFTVALIAVILFITGVYRFSLLIIGCRNVAGYAAVLAVFSSSFVETLHVFGQLPSIIGISVLMHALPEIYTYLFSGQKKNLFKSLSLIAVTVSSHHVTPIFGMLFFIFPLIGMVVMDYSKEKVGSYLKVRFSTFIKTLKHLLSRIITFGLLSLSLIIFCILPYWINSKENPITQIPIPHGSRDNFFEITSSGLSFFLIPWGILLLFFPYIFYRYYSKRYLFFGLSISILFILGTGGTTPIPELVLGETAFNILTLDRFTLWASIMSLPLFGEFTYRFVEGDIKKSFQHSFGAVFHRVLGGFLALIFIAICVASMSLSYFRPSQPQKIKMLPIVNFLNSDQHDQWRYITLGFGDQMAWLSSQTNAFSVDGNYHSARRLPELTTRAVERLENSKFKGIEGLGSLQQFLTRPEKYNLKYVFSNDKFYDPILYFCGWQRLNPLENGIEVWERLNVKPISSILPYDDIPLWQKIIWGIIPLSTVIICILIHVNLIIIRLLKTKELKIRSYVVFANNAYCWPRFLQNFQLLWIGFILSLISLGCYEFYIKNNSHYSPENIVYAYYDAVDFKRFEDAYSYIYPDRMLTMEQYMLQISVTDGIINSYAKLDDISIDIISQNDTSAVAKVFCEWITPLNVLSKVEYIDVILKNGKWYIIGNKPNVDLPPDQLIIDISPDFYNHGRRRITSEQTYHKDVLKQPSLEILNAKLIKKNSHYQIIGEIQNIDNLPADITINGTLFSEKSKELATYNAMYHMKHKLLPKEITSFRVDFEGVAWSNVKDKIPDTFNPNEFTALHMNKKPDRFNLQVAGNVSGKDLYHSVSINGMFINDSIMNITLYNSGLKEVTIPQLIISYYNKNREMIWVDHVFSEQSIRQQRQSVINYQLKDVSEIKIINKSIKHCFINGLPNKSMAREIVPNRRVNDYYNFLQPIDSIGNYFIKVELNAFLGGGEL